jgi:hypothetical protein
MTISAQFLPNYGYRYSRSGISILCHSIISAKKDVVLTSAQINNTFNRIDTLLEAISVYESHEEISDQNAITQLSDFEELNDGPFYKFVNNSTLKSMRNSSFRFGSIQYYRDIEATGSKDEMEGRTNLILRTKRQQHLWPMVAGYNFAIFCGTTQSTHTDLMRASFGDNLIRIPSAKRFAEIAVRVLGAKRYYLHRVIYRDRKIFRCAKTLRNLKISESDGWINDLLFEFLYESGTMPSLFIKPTRFQSQQEIRLAFEMGEDLPKFREVRSADLAECIEEVPIEASTSRLLWPKY